MNDNLSPRKKLINQEDILTIEEMLEKAGNNHKYQLKLLAIYFLVFMFAAFIQMGFPIIFQPAKFQCEDGLSYEECKAKACSTGNYTLSDQIKSIAYSFNLVCDRAKILDNCMSAFLLGGFIGSLYYGQVIERKGRRWGVIESLAMMCGGLYLSVLSGSTILFAFGVFFFSAGFRGFYNASLLTLTQVMNQVSRSGTPMFLSIGWAVGQITIALIGVWLTNWRVIFLLTVIPLSILLYYAYINTKESPRFCVTKHEFAEAKKIVQEIAFINEMNFRNYELKEQLQYEQKMEGYRQIMAGGQVQSRQRHHSYASLLKFNSIRIRVIIVGIIWSLFSLSYFLSANSPINPKRNIVFNIALAGVVQVIAYLFSMITSLNYARVGFIKKLILLSAVVHLVYFFIIPLDSYDGFLHVLVMTLDILVRVLMSVGNTFLAIYSIELFPTVIRHFSLGILGFITKLMYFLSVPFFTFWKQRNINPNFIIGVLFAGSYFLTVKLRETKDTPFKDNLQEDSGNLLMNETTADIF